MTEPSNDTILFAPEPVEAPRAQAVPRQVPVDLFGPPKPKRKRATRARSKAAPLPASPKAPSRPAPPAGVTAPEPREIKPIETRYAGCQFRSRLEARWAVFFDHLGIEWWYETETYLVGPFGSRRGYLPDFYLPAQNVWVEVKGDPQALDYDLLQAAASPHTGLPLTVSGGPTGWPLHKLRMVILGQVPAYPGAHKALAALGGEVLGALFTMPMCLPADRVGAWNHSFISLGSPIPVGPGALTFDGAPSSNLLVTEAPPFQPCQHVFDAYTAARSARFEHGESG